MTQSRFLISSACVAIASLALATSASAQYSMYDEGNSYLDLNTGRTDFDLSNGTGLYSSDDRDRSYSIAAGGFFRDSNVGMELGYTDFGRVGRGGGQTEAKGINLSLVGRVPLGEAFNLLGQVGGIYSRTDVSSGFASGVGDGKESGLDWTYGVGLEFAFARRWSATVQYDGYNMDFAGEGRERITNLAVGLRYVY